MINTNQPRIDRQSQTVVSVASVGAGSGETASLAPAPFPCPVCEREFKTKKGVGVHLNSAHCVVANSQIDVERKKVRWSNEEKRLVAHIEAEGMMSGILPGGINGYLAKKHPGRTLESLKARRRSAEHRQLVARYLRALKCVRLSPLHIHPKKDNTPEVVVENVTPSVDCVNDEDSSFASVRASTHRVSSANEAANSAVALLATVSGHGVPKLLKAAQDLVDRGESPSLVIASWYHEYGKCGFKSLSAGGSKHKIPSNRGKGARHRPGAKIAPRGNIKTSKKALNAAEYRRNVSQWRLGKRGFVVDRVLSGVDSKVAMPSFDEMCKYWIPIIEGDSTESRFQSPPTRVSTLTHDILTPISPDEVSSCLPSAKVSPGPDGFPARLWRRIPISLLAGLFNLFIACGELPPELTASRTIFVPKKGDPSSPCNYRPISIASVALRHYHRILARRLEKLSIVDTRQRAFRCADGVAENIFLLDSLLRDARSSCKGLCIASLDLSKAFDSVSHESIYSALRRVGLCSRFVDYLRGLYLQSGTFIQTAGQCSRALSVSKGVRQGDPLSPLIFNVVVDMALRAIPHTVGYALGSHLVNALAFADDVILVASTPLGLQRSCEAFTDRAALDGLRLNPAKSATLTQIPSGRDNKVKVVDTVYVLGGEPIPVLAISSLWRYLGVGFAGGRLEEYDSTSYVAAIGRLTAAPMKPQMRLAILRDHLIPKFVHGLTFGAVSASKLRSMSHETRRAARSWLDLPSSCPNSYIHAQTSAGGLGIPNLEFLIPKSRFNRYVRLEHSSVPAVREAFRLHGSKMLASSRRAVHRNSNKQSYQESLHASVDGCELRMCPDEPASVAYMRNPTGIPGRDFKRYAQLRINGLPSRKRVNRGRRGPINCRACGAPSETLAHIVQSCPRTNEGRLMRHDCIVKKVVGALSEKGFKVETEFLYKLQNGNLKPDIVATKGDDADDSRSSVICDVQVVSANNTRVWHTNKIRKYADRPDLHTAIRARHHSTNVQTVALTINWRGVWLADSSQCLKSLGLSSGLLGGIATRVLQGSVSNWLQFNTRTDMYRRVGVG